MDTEVGDDLVKRYSRLAQDQNSSGHYRTINGIGGFASVLEPQDSSNPQLLVTGCDGIGTKLLLGIEHGTIASLGQDLVAMSINDILCCGATPSFFLDYYSTGHLDPGQAEAFVAGVAQACSRAGCLLVGGETAEMPGLYADGHFDAAGFAVGTVHRDELLRTESTRVGDSIVALTSAGPHSNGYSLVRRLLEDHQPPADVLQELLAPTLLYTNVWSALANSGIPRGSIRGGAHMTGGGITGNLNRALAHHQRARLDLSSWEFPVAMRWLRETSGTSTEQMLATFNCGVGFLCDCRR